MQIPTLSDTERFFSKDERCRIMGLSTSEVLKPVPNQAGNGPRVTAMMRMEHLAVGEE